MPVKYEWHPDLKLVARDFGEMADEIGDFRNPMQIAREPALEDMQARFINGGPAPDGTPWPPWSQSYAESGRGNRLMDLSGDLMTSVTSRENFVVVGNEMLWNSGAAPERWQWHNEGRLNRSSSPLPQREFVGLSDAAMVEIVVIFEEHMEEVIVYQNPARAARIQPRSSLGTFLPATPGVL